MANLTLAAMFGDTVPLEPVTMNEEDIEKVCGWKFGLLKTKISSVIDGVDNSYQYELIEIYSRGGHINDIRVLGESPEEVIKYLEVALHDLKNNLEVIGNDS